MNIFSSWNSSATFFFNLRDCRYKKWFRKHNECPCTYLPAPKVKRYRHFWSSGVCHDCCGWRSAERQATASALLPASSLPGSSQAGTVKVLCLQRNNSMAHLNKLRLGVSLLGAFCSPVSQTTKERLSLCPQNPTACNDPRDCFYPYWTASSGQRTCLCCSSQYLLWCLVSACERVARTF